MSPLEAPGWEVIFVLQTARKISTYFFALCTFSPIIVFSNCGFAAKRRATACDTQHISRGVILFLNTYSIFGHYFPFRQKGWNLNRCNLNHLRDNHLTVQKEKTHTTSRSFVGKFLSSAWTLYKVMNALWRPVHGSESPTEQTTFFVGSVNSTEEV